MSESLWARYEAIATPEEVKEEAGKWDKLPTGDYIATLEKIVPDEVNSLPVLKINFRTLDNKVASTMMFLQSASDPKFTASNIADAVKFVGSVLNEQITFVGMGALEADVNRANTDCVGKTYKIHVFYGKKDLECKYTKIKVLELMEEVDPSSVEDDEDIPF